MTKLKSKIILGISAFYHDSAAAVIVDGNILAAAQEERFTRIKHDSAFPHNSINACLEKAQINIEDVDHVIFYEKPFLKFERLLETYLSLAPKGFLSFRKAIPIWIKEKLFQKHLLKKEISQLGNFTGQLHFSSHHYSHAASAFFPSPFNEAMILCMDGVGEWATTSLWRGNGNRLELIKEIHFPHSLGLLYSAFTYYIGFKVNSGEYKLMGLAPYGQDLYSKIIKEKIVNIASDGSFQLDMQYFDFAVGLTMTNKRFHCLFGKEARLPESQIEQFHMDIAKSIQVVTEEILLKLTANIKSEFKIDNLCLAGGVALNCVANGKIIEQNSFKNVWIQPAAGDAGGSLGAALGYWFEGLNQPRVPLATDSMQGSFLGSQFSNQEIKLVIKENNLNAEYFNNENELISQIATLLSLGKIGGLLQGRMEFGPRSLGARSIIADPRSEKMQTTLNLKIKYRESFRPFAPAILAEKVGEWFELDYPSPYMLSVSKIKTRHRNQLPMDYQELFGIEKLKIARSSVPAITHLDFSARVQTVHKETNPFFYKLLQKFDQLTNIPMLVNTSFNVRGEPIVQSPLDAIRCFMNTDMDFLVLEGCLLLKDKQSKDLKFEKIPFIELD